MENTFLGVMCLLFWTFFQHLLFWCSLHYIPKKHYTFEILICLHRIHSSKLKGTLVSFPYIPAHAQEWVSAVLSANHILVNGPTLFHWSIDGGNAPFTMYRCISKSREDEEVLNFDGKRNCLMRKEMSSLSCPADPADTLPFKQKLCLLENSTWPLYVGKKDILRSYFMRSRHSQNSANLLIQEMTQCFEQMRLKVTKQNTNHL